MTNSLRPLGAIESSRRAQAGQDDIYDAEFEDVSTGVETEPDAGFDPQSEQPTPRPRRQGFAAFAAQMLGQGGQKRGLRGGPETLDRARATYLGTEWSGPSDRRPRPGRITKTEI